MFTDDGIQITPQNSPESKMLIQCGQCGKTLKVPDSAAGKQAKCPACSTLIRIPAPAAADPESPPRPARDATAGDRRSAEPSPPRRISQTGDESAAGAARTERSRPSRSSASDRTAARRGSQASSGRSSSAGKPQKRRRPEPVDEFEEVSEEDPWGFGDDFADENPYSAPPPVHRPRRSGSGGSNSRTAGLDTVGRGLLIQGWSIAVMLITFAGVIVLGMLGVFASMSGARGGGIIAMAIGGLGGIVILVAGLGVLVGEFICLATPEQSGAKGLIQTAVSCLTVQIVISLVVNLGAASLSQVVFLTLVILSGLAGIVHFVTYLLFQKAIANYVGRHDLAGQAQLILTGMGAAIGGIIFVNILAALGAGAIAGLLALVIVLPAGIAAIVFAVMQLFLLFRLGAALRES